MVFQIFVLEWVILRRLVDLLTCWNRRVSQNDINFVWNIIHSFMMWCIWREKNSRNFDDRERTSSNLRTSFLKFHLSRSLPQLFSMFVAMLIFVLFSVALDCWVVLLHTSCVLGLCLLRF
jgi:hypothetical protein